METQKKLNKDSAGTQWGVDSVMRLIGDSEVTQSRFGSDMSLHSRNWAENQWRLRRLMETQWRLSGDSVEPLN